MKLAIQLVELHHSDREFHNSATENRETPRLLSGAHPQEENKDMASFMKLAMMIH